jgi:hypothetical protein
MAPLNCCAAPALLPGPKIEQSFTVRYKPLAPAVDSFASERLDRRIHSRSLDRVTNDHLGISQIAMRINTTATTPAEVH